MHALSTGQLLDVWEYGLSWPPAQRALELLAAAYPDTTWDTWAALSVGQRDARLLTLREELWGTRMAAVVLCPRCRNRLDVPLDVREMLSNSLPNQATEISLTIAGFSVAFRLPTSQDVIDAASRGANPEACRALLLERCVLSARQGDVQVGSDQLPAEVIAALGERMAEADPLADIQLALNCPSCAHDWLATFDIVSFLWTEIEIWARRILTDVHTLARAYGWCERDILSISPMRRQFYLEMVGA